MTLETFSPLLHLFTSGNDQRAFLMTGFCFANIKILLHQRVMLKQIAPGKLKNEFYTGL